MTRRARLPMADVSQYGHDETTYTAYLHALSQRSSWKNVHFDGVTSGDLAETSFARSTRPPAPPRAGHNGLVACETRHAWCVDTTPLCQLGANPG